MDFGNVVNAAINAGKARRQIERDRIKAGITNANTSANASMYTTDADMYRSDLTAADNANRLALDRNKFQFEQYQDRRQQQRDAQLQRLLFGETLYGDSADAYPQLKDGSLDFEGQAIVGENGPELISTKKNGKVDVIPLTPPTDMASMRERAIRGVNSGNSLVVPSIPTPSKQASKPPVIIPNADTLTGATAIRNGAYNVFNDTAKMAFDNGVNRGLGVTPDSLVKGSMLEVSPYLDDVNKVRGNKARTLGLPYATMRTNANGASTVKIPTAENAPDVQGIYGSRGQKVIPSISGQDLNRIRSGGNGGVVDTVPSTAWGSLNERYAKPYVENGRKVGIIPKVINNPARLTGNNDSDAVTLAKLAAPVLDRIPEYLFGMNPGFTEALNNELAAKNTKGSAALSPEVQQSMAMYKKMKANKDNPYGLPMLKPDKNGRYDQATIDRIKASKSNPITAPGAEEYVRNLPSASSKPLLSPREAFLFYHGNNPMSKEIMSRDTGAEKAQSKQNLDAAKFARNIRNDRFNEIKDRLGDDPKLINEFLGLSDGLPSAILQRGYINDRGKMRDFDLSTLLNAHTKARSRTLKQIEDSKSIWVPESSENTPDYQETLMLEFLKELGYQTAPKGS